MMGREREKVGRKTVEKRGPMWPIGREAEGPDGPLMPGASCPHPLPEALRMLPAEAAKPSLIHRDRSELTFTEIVK